MDTDQSKPPTFTKERHTHLEQILGLARLDGHWHRGGPAGRLSGGLSSRHVCRWRASRLSLQVCRDALDGER